VAVTVGLLLLALIGFVFLRRLGRAVRWMARHHESRRTLLAAVAMLAGGTVFYRLVEGWTWLDALYFCVVTLATIGYGDLAPKTGAGKAFTIVFVLIGIGIIADLFRTLARVPVDVPGLHEEPDESEGPPPPNW
jgi:dipeptide/tripeptide permease